MLLLLLHVRSIFEHQITKRDYQQDFTFSRSYLRFFLKIGPTPASFLFIFGLFKQTIQFLQQINVKKCPSSIRRWDSNPRPLERESTPITTRPGLPPSLRFLP